MHFFNALAFVAAAAALEAGKPFNLKIQASGSSDTAKAANGKLLSYAVDRTAKIPVFVLVADASGTTPNPVELTLNKDGKIETSSDKDLIRGLVHLETASSSMEPPTLRFASDGAAPAPKSTEKFNFKAGKGKGEWLMTPEGPQSNWQVMSLKTDDDGKPLTIKLTYGQATGGGAPGGGAASSGIEVVAVEI